MASVIVRKEVWHKPPTHFYEDNYNFGINFYQPMIDYLNAKDKNRAPKDYPHLPWNNERGLSEYNSRKLVRAYSGEDLTNLRIKAENQARKDLDTFKIAKRSDFSLKKSVSAASLTKHVDSVSKEKIVKNTVKTQHQAMADYSAIESDLLHDALKSAEKFHIARSAKAIEGTLRYESMKNLSENTEMDITSYKRQMTSSTTLHDEREHVRAMEARRIVNEELDQLMRPLDDLKIELQGFNAKTSNYFELKSLSFLFFY